VSDEGTVLFGFIHNGIVRTEFMTSLTRALTEPVPHQYIGGIFDSTCGPLIAMARNNLAARFLETDFEWLWTVDTDIQFAPDTLPRLIEAADPVTRPVVSALYHVLRDGRQGAAAYDLGPDAKGEFTTHNDWPENELVEVAGVGAGCLLIHRSALNALNLHEGRSWFREMTVGGTQVGEDLSFCIRLHNYGVPIYLHTGVGVAHHKTVPLGAVT
jgi:GT2 family glycosyltransferase